MKKIINFIMSIPADKLLHFIAGMCVTAISLILVKLVSLDLKSVFIIPFIVVNLFGVGKELYDKFHPRHVAEVKDYLYTVAGGILGIILEFPLFL